MELAGEEKKLQALFSELKTADEQIAPPFATVWNRAQLRPRRLRALTAALVAATALVVFGLFSLAVWLKSSKTSQPEPREAVVSAPQIDNAPGATAPASARPNIVVPVKRESVKREFVAKARTRRDAQLVATNKNLTREAKAISGWQSPTTALMSSPGSEIFSSLPQFSQSTSDLKSFLPSRSN